jgi:hypothetical protein
MTTDDRDPLLQTLFDEAELDFDDEVFSSVVLARTRARRVRIAAGGICAGLVLLAGAMLFAAPLHEFANLLAMGLGTTLIDLGDSWVAWIFSPVNTIGSLLIVGAKGIRMGRKRIVSASYA